MKDSILDHDLKVEWPTEAMAAEVAAIGEAAAAADRWRLDLCLLRRLDSANQSHFGRQDHPW